MEQTLGKRIVANRKRLGLTQEQLAEKLGVTAQAVSKWENDQSCPDITILPQLADIFVISTDELLGRGQADPVHETEIVSNDKDGVHVHKGNWEFQWDSGKKGALGLAALVLLVGCLYLLSNLFTWNLSFWDILWPSAVLIFGLIGIISKFTFFSLGCTVFGVYFLLNDFIPATYVPNNKIIWAVLILLFGVSLLIDALRKSKKPKFHMSYTDKNGTKHYSGTKNDYSTFENSFEYNASFGENRQLVELSCLEHGEVTVSFGEYTIDLSGVSGIAPDCMLDLNCNFGELTILVPAQFTIVPDSSTAFAAFSINGESDQSSIGEIHVNASVSFGEICIRYI